MRKPLGHLKRCCRAGKGTPADMGGPAAVEKRRQAWPGHLGCATGSNRPYKRNREAKACSPRLGAVGSVAQGRSTACNGGGSALGSGRGR